MRKARDPRGLGPPYFSTQLYEGGRAKGWGHMKQISSVDNVLAPLNLVGVHWESRVG